MGSVPQIIILYMHLRDFLGSLSRKLLLIIASIIIVIGIIFFIWKKNKYSIVNDTIADTIAKKTDSLYTIKYDSLHFDELTGKAYLKNIHIGPDTAIIRNMKPEDLPYILLDIKIATLKISGVKTDKAFLGKQMIGDSVIVDHPGVTVYFLKSLQKQTKIDVEAKTVYGEILGNLTRIQVGHVFLNDIHINGIDFFTKQKLFDVTNGNIRLNDVLIDSAHNPDTSRTLFCKQSELEVASFVTYNNSRPELRVSKLNYSGKDKFLSFADISVNKFESEIGDSDRLLHATNLSLKGLNTNEIVKNKNIIIDTIDCQQITLYQPATKNIIIKKADKPKPQDSTGFMHVYSIDMRHLSFPKVTFIPTAKSSYTLGNIAIKINEVQAAEVIDVENHPIDYSREAEISCDKISINSKDGLYKYTFQNTAINSLQKGLKIGSVVIKPLLSENAFAIKAHFQKDRYDVVLSGIALKNIDMKNLLDKKIIASDLIINKVSAKDYIDLQKPTDGKNKVGNYPGQLLTKIDFPIHISHVLLSNAFVEYREKETLSDSTGDVKFTGSTINIDNVTNMPEHIKENNAMKITFKSKALGIIPIKGSFTFFMGDTAGRFEATGHILSFDVHLLNVVSVPMALLRLNSGVIHSLDFNFKGDNLGAGGKLVMKYSGLKVDLLRNDKKSNDVKKKKLVSFFANMIVKNDNPSGSDLREVNPHFDRNVQKSFFNLVWKTILKGMKKTAGVP